jgi:hypothetical protein
MRVSCRYPRRHAGVVYRMSRVDYGLYYSKLAPTARKSFPAQHGGTEKPCASSGTGRWGLRAPTRRREPNRDTEHPRAMGAMGTAHSTAQHRSATSWTTITNVRPTSRLISTPPPPGFCITPCPSPQHHYPRSPSRYPPPQRHSNPHPQHHNHGHSHLPDPAPSSFHAVQHHTTRLVFPNTPPWHGSGAQRGRRTQTGVRVDWRMQECIETAG